MEKLSDRPFELALSVYLTFRVTRKGSQWVGGSLGWWLSLGESSHNIPHRPPEPGPTRSPSEGGHGWGQPSLAPSSCEVRLGEFVSLLYKDRGEAVNTCLPRFFSCNCLR